MALASRKLSKQSGNEKAKGVPVRVIRQGLEVCGLESRFAVLSAQRLGA